MEHDTAVTRQCGESEAGGEGAGGQESEAAGTSAVRDTAAGRACSGGNGLAFAGRAGSACNDTSAVADAGAEQGGGEGLAVLCERARELHEDAGDFDAAHEVYERILTLDPGHVETLCNFALLLETTLVRALMSEPGCVPCALHPTVCAGARDGAGACGVCGCFVVGRRALDLCLMRGL